MLELDGTIIVIAISFIIFTLIMQAIFYKPMTKVRNERSRYIRNNRRYAKFFEAKKYHLIDKKQSQIIKAKQEANEILNKETSQAHKKKAEVVSEALMSSKQKVEGHKNELEQQKNRTKEELKSEISMIASDISSKILGVHIPITGITDELIENVLNG